MPTFEELAKQKGISLMPTTTTAPTAPLNTQQPQISGVTFEDFAKQKGVQLTPLQPVVPQEQGLLDKLGGRFDQIKGALDVNKTPSIGGVQQFSPRQALRVGGALAGGVGDVFNSILENTYKLSVPEPQRKALSEFQGFLQSKLGTGTGVFKIEDLMKSFSKLEEKHPTLGRDIRDLTNIATLLPVEKLIKAPGVVGPKMPTGDFIDVTIDQAISKGVKPSMKPTAAKATEYTTKAREAFKVVNEYKPTFVDDVGEPIVRNPKNTSELLDAIGQSKSKVFTEYDNLAKETGDAGASISVTPVINRLVEVSGNLKYNPDIRNYASELVGQMQELQGASPSIIQARIQDLNSSLGALYDGRITKAKAQIDASVAAKLREELDSQINRFTGANYQELKNKYGALSTIERDVARQVAVQARKANKGLIDFTDIFTGGDLIMGVLGANPAVIARGLAGRGLKEWMKYLNNPDRYIQKAFEALDKVPIVPKPRNKPKIQTLLPAGKPGFKNPKGMIDLSDIITPPPTTFEPKAKNIKMAPVPKAPELLRLPPGKPDPIITPYRDASRVLSQEEAKSKLPVSLKGRELTQTKKAAGIFTPKKPTAKATKIGTTRTLDQKLTGKERTLDKGVAKVDPLVKEAKKYKSAEEFVKAQQTKSIKPEGGMSHRPTQGPPAHDLLAKVDGDSFAPNDIYTHPEYYGNGGDLSDKQSIAALLKIKGKPDTLVTIYRASPKNELRSGDWVSLSQSYAKGESLSEGTKVNSFKVKASDIKWAGDSLNEFGYYPDNTRQLTDIWNKANKKTRKLP